MPGVYFFHAPSERFIRLNLAGVDYTAKIPTAGEKWLSYGRRAQFSRGMTFGRVFVIRNRHRKTRHDFRAKPKWLWLFYVRTCKPSLGWCGEDGESEKKVPPFPFSEPPSFHPAGGGWPKMFSLHSVLSSLGCSHTYHISIRVAPRNLENFERMVLFCVLENIPEESIMPKCFYEKIQLFQYWYNLYQFWTRSIFGFKDFKNILSSAIFKSMFWTAILLYWFYTMRMSKTVKSKQTHGEFSKLFTYQFQTVANSERTTKGNRHLI